MKSFYEGLEQDDAELIETLSRASYELRENRKLLLEQYGAAEEKQILEKIAAHELPEHPAYEHYLSVTVLAEMQEAVRSELANILQETKTV
jgi:hypothetical protein